MARILLVDPDFTHSARVRGALERAGYAVTVATSSAEVDDSLAEHSEQFQIFNLAIFATQVNGEDGFEMYSEFKDKIYPLPPVIFMAKQKSIETAVQASDLGARMVLTLPIQVPKFLELVDGILNGARG